MTEELPSSHLELDDIQAAKREDRGKCLITRNGAYYISTGKYFIHSPLIHKYMDSGLFQLRNRLYCCGGYNQSLGFSGEMNCKTERGRMMECEDMKFARSRLGLGGVNQYLAALGGRDREGTMRDF